MTLRPVGVRFTGSAPDLRPLPHVAGEVVHAEGRAAEGKTADGRVEWLGGDMGTFSRRDFEVPAPGPASSYRVRVFAFDFLQAALREAP